MVSKSMGSSEACLDTDRCIESAPVDMYPKCGYVTEAHAVFERITDPDTILWFTILSGHRGLVEEGLHHFSLMKQLVIRCQGWNTKLVLLTSYITLYLQHVGSMKMWSWRRLQPDTSAYNAMICKFISVGNIDECVKYFKGMSSNGCDPNVDTYTKLIAGLLKARKVADALEMFDEILSRGFVATMGTITSFMEPLCSFGQPYAAMMIYQKARKECGYASAIEVYEYVINGLCDIGQLENAVLVMEESLWKGLPRAN
ncbi:hypothetical protein ACLB2K_047497 [Fragaria x ananassa]